MRVTRTEFQSHAFILAPDDLRRFDDACTRYIGPPAYDAECADKLVRSYANIDELIQYENPKASEIRLLTCRARSPDYSAEMTLSWSHSGDRNVYMSLAADERVAGSMNQELDNRLEATRAWYSFIARPDLLALVERAVSILVVLAVLSMAATFLAAGPSQFQVASTLRTLSRGVITGAAIVIPLAILEWLRTRFFPMGTFRLGQGQKRFEDSERLRVVVIFGFAVSVAAGIFVAFLVAR
jgi:hypothetical protein